MCMTAAWCLCGLRRSGLVPYRPMKKMRAHLRSGRGLCFAILHHRVLALLTFGGGPCRPCRHLLLWQALLPSSPPIAHDPSTEAVEIYEDPDAAEDDQPQPTEPSQPTQATQILSQYLHSSFKTQATALSSVLEDFSDNDEENDPIIHSFGPFGANLLPRMAAFQTGESPRLKTSPKTSRSFHNEPLQPTLSPPQPLASSGNFDVKSHIINQLAFSRLSSTPLSTILSHLPAEAGTLTKDDLRVIIEETSCIGEVTREGKDAAGKQLESEFYYVPEYDGDKQRSEAVTNDLRKPGLRACRKQHKVSIYEQY